MPFYSNKKPNSTMDVDILKTINVLKISFITYCKYWDLENAYWTIRQIRSEIDCKLDNIAQKELDKEIDELENYREKWVRREIKDGEFYIKLEQVYIKMNRWMVEFKFFFNEEEGDYGDTGDDMTDVIEEGEEY